MRFKWVRLNICDCVDSMSVLLVRVLSHTSGVC
jgi:hypothetical protein